MDKFQQQLLMVVKQAAKVQADGLTKLGGQAAELVFEPVQPF